MTACDLLPIRRRIRADLAISVLALGTSEIGFQDLEKGVADRLLNSALDCGMNAIDTAECYPKAEPLIGEFLAHRRSEFLLFTKCGHRDGWSKPDWSREGILASVCTSLRQMRTGHVDLLQLHSCSTDILKKDDAIEALILARERGYTRFIGYSGDGDDAQYAVDCGAFDTIQLSINIADQEAIDLVLPNAVARGLTVLVKRPLANAIWRSPCLPVTRYYQPYWRRLEELRYPFLRDDGDAAATALRFAISVPGVDAAIVGTANPDRCRENAAIARLGPLPPEQYEAIRERWKQVARPDWCGQI